VAFVAVTLIGALSACGTAAKHAAPASHRGASGIGTEPPQTQHPPLDPSFARQVVAHVGAHSITRAYLERWTSLQVVISSTYKYGSTVPTGYVPDPPIYRYCIAYLRATGGVTQAGSRATPEQLKTQCEHEHRTQVENALGHLIRYAQIHEEAAKRDVAVSAAEIQHEIAKRGIKALVLNALGIQPSDQEFIVGAELLTRKMFATLPAYRRMRRTGDGTIKAADEIDNEDVKFYASIARRWTLKTHCEPEFIVPGCSEYSSEGLLP
jgi:hypothetical protein